MKKKIFGIVAIVLFAMAIAFNTQMVNSTEETGEVVLENIEALASHGGGSGVSCSCGLIWGKGCKADNWGGGCAPGSICWIYDQNCSQ